jgi:hypothetical protein
MTITSTFCINSSKFQTTPKKIVGCKSEIDKYYDNQESLLKSFAEMDEVTKRGGYVPTTTQVRVIHKLVQKLFHYIHKLQIYVTYFFTILKFMTNT